MGKLQDLRGKRFGKLVAIRRGINRGHKKDRITWVCRCKCGQMTTVRSDQLKDGTTKSCGCQWLESVKKFRHKHEGKRFGRWEVYSYEGKNRYLCKCSCGRFRSVKAWSLVSGRSISCGCYHADVCGKQARHGMTGTKAYRAWSSMRARCYNPTNKSYNSHGAMGITVCKRWMASFEAFYKDMGDPPSPSHSLDRRNPWKNYTPSNCHWGTPGDQSQNRRNSIIVNLKGERMCLSEAARQCGIRPVKALDRVKKGWTIKQALELEPRLRRWDNQKKKQVARM